VSSIDFKHDKPVLLQAFSKGVGTISRRTGNSYQTGITILRVALFNLRVYLGSRFAADESR
jgi:hypothetical protein